MTSVAEPASAPRIEVAGIWQIGTQLVLVRSGGAGARWRLPGGRVRVGETLAEAVVRTVADDTGVDALCGPFVGWAELPATTPHVVTMYFEAVVLDPPEIDRATGAMPAGPHDDEVRCTPDWEVSEVLVVPGLAEFLADQGLIELVV